MRYDVRLAPAAVRALKKLAPRERERIVARIETLAEEPRPADGKKLSGLDSLYRVRVRDHRIVYAVRDAELLVLVVRVGHRRDVYRDL